MNSAPAPTDSPSNTDARAGQAKAHGESVSPPRPPLRARLVSRLRAGDGVGPALILATTLWRLLPDLDHPGIHDFDEAMHLAVARGLLDTPLVPHLNPIPIGHVNPEDWIGGHIWLHKPPGSLWMSAAMMAIFGVGTGAARFPSLFGMLLAALALYGLLKPSTNRVVATLAAMSLVSLPFTFDLVHGYMFGDLTDTTLAGFVAASVAMLVYAARKNSLPAALAAGALCGMGYLCKSALALTPLGVAAVLVAARVLRPDATLRPSRFVATALLAAVVALPWTLYASRQWPELWAAESRTVFQHLTSEEAAKNPAIRTWIRPVDAILSEHHARTLAPIPRAVPVLAGLWLLYSAFRTRRIERIAVAAWLWATWIVLSVAAAKVPATDWGAIAAMFFAMGVLVFDSLKRPLLSGAVLGALLGEAIPLQLPPAAVELLPLAWGSTRANPGMLVGLLWAVSGAAIVWLLLVILRRGRAALGRSLNVVTCGLAVACALPGAFIAQAKLAEAVRAQGFNAHVKEAAEAVAKVSPPDSFIWLGLSWNSPAQLEPHNAIFWSGRSVILSRELAQTGVAQGLAPYLLSARAEPFEPLAVPAGAWSRAYDVSKPAAPPPIPTDAKRVDADVGSGRVIGFASSPTPHDQDRWALFVEPRGAQKAFEFRFVHRDGARTVALADPARSLMQPSLLDGVSWYVIPVFGPKTEDVVGLEFAPAPPK